MNQHMLPYFVQLFFIILLCITSKHVNSYKRLVPTRSIASVERSHKIYTQTLCAKKTSTTPPDMNDPGLIEYLKGPMGKKAWKGTTDMLERRGQIPLDTYTPTDVVKILMAALGSNDDPQLDHGACVALSFRSPSGPLSGPALDPSSYGAFLRNTEYKILLDYKAYELVDVPIDVVDSLSVKQQVRIEGWKTGETPGFHFFDFYLTNTNNQWLLDVILAKK